MHGLSRRAIYMIAALLVLPGPIATVASVTTPVASSPQQSASTNCAFQTLLDPSGHLDVSVTPEQVAGWRRAAADTQSSASDKARADVALGEYLLATEREPDQAITCFKAAAAIPGLDRSTMGLAQYDTALALFAEGAYRESEDAFRALDTPVTALPGYSSRYCALWLRHAIACAAYHAQHAALGIPEPPRLDPFCGAAALATYLKANGRPFDKDTVASYCQITGEGDDLADLIVAGKTLGIAIHVVQATDRGLVELPKPLICHAESDHFIAVIHADKSGVTYVCSDCGAWPGGQVHLTWSQWHALDADAYGVMTAPGSDWDKALGLIESKAPISVQVASTGRLMGFVPRADLLASMVRGDVIALYTGSPYSCNRYVSPECAPGCVVCCPWLNLLGFEGGGFGSFGAGALGASDAVGRGAAGSAGAMASEATADGEPSTAATPATYAPGSIAADGSRVNLATGDFDYNPAPDLVVYNATGPSVVWQRLYTELAVPPFSGDFGGSWNQAYGYEIWENPVAGTLNFFYPNGAELTFSSITSPTSSAPTTPIPVSTTYPGYPLLLQWNYVSGSSYGQFVLTLKDHTVWTFTQQANNSGVNVYTVANVADPNGSASTSNSIDLTYGVLSGIISYPYIEYIKDHTSGTTLLTVHRNSTSNLVDYVYDNNSRTVYYSPAASPYSSELGTVSLINDSSAAHYTYTYNLPNTIDIGPPFMTSISVPSPTGSGTGTGYIDYNSNQYVSETVDANGNATYCNSTNAFGSSSSNSAYTEAIYDGNASNTVYTRISGYNANMSSVTTADFGNGITSDTTAFDTSTDPYRPSTSYDGDALYATTPGNAVTLTPYGSDTPGSGYSWEIYNKAGSPVDYSATNGHTGTGGWTVNASGSSITVTPPSGSGNIAAHYEVRSSASSPTSSYFDVYATAKGSSSFTWDDLGNCDTAEDSRGTKETFSWNTSNFGLGDLTEAQASDPSTDKIATNYSYAATGGSYKNGLITEITSPLPGTVYGTGSTVNTTFTYDESTYAGSETTLNLLTTEVDPGTASYSTITSHWNYVSDSDYASNGTPGTYSTTAAIGEPIVFVNGDGQETHYRYDAYGNCTMVIDALGNETAYTYNLANQMTSATQYTPYSGGSHTMLSADIYNYLYVGGPLTSIQTENGSSTIVREVDGTYGAEGELLSLSAKDDPSYPTTSITIASATYDPLYRVKTITDGNGNTTTYTYSTTTGDVSLVQYPGAGTDTSGSDTLNYPAFDPDGHLLTRIDGNSAETDYSYDDADSYLTKVAYPSGTIANAALTYDGFGRFASLTDGVFLQVSTNPGEAFTYDDDNDILTKTVNYSSSVLALEGLEISYGYNQDGSRASMTVPTYSSSGDVAGTFDYSYDDVGRMTGLTNPSGGAFSWSYDNNSWLASQLSKDAAGNTMVDTTYTYDPRGDVTDLRNYQSGGSTMWSEFGGDGIGSDPPAMTYDPNQNRLTMQATEAGHTAYSGGVTYTYDYKNELTSEASYRNGGSGSAVDNAFDYDGNFTELRGSSVPTANSDDQLTATGYSFDGDGNPTTYSGNTLSFDPENRLTKYVAGSTTDMQAGYGLDGLRAWRTDSSNTTVYYLYDGSMPVVQLSSSGVVNVVSTVGVNGVVSRYSENFAPTGDDERFYAFDPQGNCAEMIDDAGSSGTLLLSATYDSFGQEHASPTTYYNDAFDSFGAQWGYFADNTGTGLELLGHRFYDEANGRFINRDPIGYDGGIDLYEYAADGPQDRADPSGYSGAGLIVGGGGIIGAPGFGAGGNVFAGGGVFWGGPGGTNVGGFYGGGGYGQAGPYQASTPTPSGPIGGVGASLGGGVGGYVTNADNNGQLGGSFNQVDVELGPIAIQFSWSPGSNQPGYGTPIVIIGVEWTPLGGGGGIAYYPTWTYTPGACGSGALP
jgi:RHS repeat-associated protein